MEIKTKHIRPSMDGSLIIELIIEGDNNIMREEVTDMNNMVDENLIINLRQIADELEDQNTKIKENGYT